MSTQIEEEVDIDVDEEVPPFESGDVARFEEEHVDDVEVPEPEESEWEEGTSPYDGDEDDQDQPEPKGLVGASSLVASYVRTGAAVIAWCLGKTSWWPAGMCQQFTRMAFNVGSGAPSASAEWHSYAKKKHPTSNSQGIPKAVPLTWLGGSRGFGHKAVSLGNGLCRSTDWPSAGRVGTARIDDITRVWGQNFVGWAEDINGVTVWEAPKPALPVISASRAAQATRREGRIKNATILKKAVGKETGIDVDLSHRVLGKGFRTAYREVQKKYLKSIKVKATEKNADGIPGPASLAWLGRQYGFRTKE